MNPLRFERGAAMVARVLDEARGIVGDADATRVAEAVHRALAQREENVTDDHDPRYLHTARAVRILLADVALCDVTALRAAAFFESVDVLFAGSVGQLDDETASAIAAIPRPHTGAEDVLEQLITADEPLAIVALAERLDHARHLHMRDDLAWPAFHASVRAEWIPAARRIAPSLARRFEHWADAFERRLVLPR